MSPKTIFVLMGCFSIVWPADGFSRPVLEPHQLTLSRERHSSVRSRGMAGTGLVQVSDWNAVYLNPSLIGDPLGNPRSRGLQSLTFPALTGEVSPSTLGLFDQLSEATRSPEGFAPVLQAFEEGQGGVRTRAEFFPSLVFGRLFFGLHSSLGIDAKAYRLSDPRPSQHITTAENMEDVDSEAIFFGRGESYIVTGFSVLASKNLSVGLMARYGLRSTIWGTSELGVGTEERGLESASERVELAHGFQVDAGLTYEFWTDGGGRAALVGRNLQGAQFVSLEPDKPVLEDEWDLDFVIGLAPRFRRSSFSPSFAVEFLELIRDDIDFSSKVRIGGEVGFAPRYRDSVFSLRAGHDLYGLSYGASINLFLFQVEVASFNQRVHLPRGASRNETRYLLRTSWDLQL